MWPGKVQWQTTSLPLNQYWKFSFLLSCSPKPLWFYLCVARGKGLNKARLQCANHKISVVTQIKSRNEQMKENPQLFIFQCLRPFYTWRKAGRWVIASKYLRLTTLRPFVCSGNEFWGHPASIAFPQWYVQVASCPSSGTQEPCGLPDLAWGEAGPPECTKCGAQLPEGAPVPPEQLRGHG